MNDEILGTASYRCDKCGASYRLNHDDFDFKVESTSDRQKGVILHQYVSEFDDICDECYNRINMTFRVWEYPKGIINYTKNDSNGAKILKSHFEFTATAPPAHDSGQLLKSLFALRFDKFAEFFLDNWIALFKKEPWLTVIGSIFVVLTLLSISVLIGYNYEKDRLSIYPDRQNYTQQYNLLDETRQDLDRLELFIASKKTEIEKTKALLARLEQSESELSPIVSAHQSSVQNMLLEERKKLEQRVWGERVFSIMLGIFIALFATIIWHSIARYKRRKYTHHAATQEKVRLRSHQM